MRFGVVGTGCIGMEHLRNLALLPNAYVSGLFFSLLFLSFFLSFSR